MCLITIRWLSICRQLDELCAIFVILINVTVGSKRLYSEMFRWISGRVSSLSIRPFLVYVRAVVCVTRCLCERVNICGQSSRYQDFVRPVHFSLFYEQWFSRIIDGLHSI